MVECSVATQAAGQPWLLDCSLPVNRGCKRDVLMGAGVEHLMSRLADLRVEIQ